MSDDDDGVEFDFGAAIGASSSVSTQVLTIFVPNRDSIGNLIDVEAWISEFEEVLADIGGGFTTEPPASAGWRNPDTGQLVRERTVRIWTFIHPEKLIEQAPRLRALLHRFGREMRQGEVGVELEQFFRITEYQP